MESNLELLTKAYIEYAIVGPLMNTLKTSFKRSSTKVFEKCKNCISKLRDSILEAPIPTVTWELFYESYKTKEEPNPDPTSVLSSTAIPDPVTWDFALVIRDSSAFTQR